MIELQIQQNVLYDEAQVEIPLAHEITRFFRMLFYKTFIETIQGTV